MPTVFAAHPPPNYADLSLEELAGIQITSVSKKPERLADSPASVYVINREDIRRSGATSLPEALRLAPNLNVFRGNASGYAVSARGLNGTVGSSPNKLLVMIDGRSVYTPFFSGVFWDVQDVMLEDVDRIEVISGPGGTLWGVNAVNGVINVITRSSKETQGQLASATVGNRANSGAFRHGGMLNNGSSFRVYGKYDEHDHGDTDSGVDMNDAWHKSQVGFRSDWGDRSDRISVHGNAYEGRFGQPLPGTVAIAGQNLLLDAIKASGVNLTTSWERQLHDGSSLNLQAYLDHTERTVPPTFAQTLDILDLQLQHSLRPLGKHSITWGVNYRYGRDRVTNTRYIAFLPAHVNQKWASIFAQDEIAFNDDLKLTVGARVERNSYTGNEFLPNVRLAWNPAENHLLWTAVSRTVRAPSRLDVDAFIPGRAPFLLRGGNEVVSEVAKVYEVGYRGQVTRDLTWSVTVFHNDYDHLRTQEIDPGRTHFLFKSLMEGKATGMETWGTYQATKAWRLSAGMTLLNEELRLKPGSNDVTGPDSAGRSPKHTWRLTSSWNITPKQELDVSIRRIAALSGPAVPAYTAVDARFGWKLRPDLELSVIGQNLFGSRHGEYGPVETRAELPSAVAVKLVWQH